MVRNRRSRVVLTGAVAILVAALINPMPVQADDTTVAWTHTFTGGSVVTSDVGATVGCSSTHAVTSYALNGDTDGTVPTPSATCNQVVVDKDGNSFVLAGNGTDPILTSFTKAGVSRWTQPVQMPKLCEGQTDSNQHLQNLVVGGDSNLYGVVHSDCTGDNGADLSSLVSFNGATGTLRFNMQDYFFGVSGIFPYKNGLVLSNSSNISFYSYEGTFISKSFYEGGSYGDVSSVTADGNAIVVNTGSSSNCNTGGMSIASIESFTSWGHEWRIEPNIECVSHFKAQAMPDNGVALLAVVEEPSNPNGGYETEIHRYGAKGSGQQWFVTLPAILGFKTFDSMRDSLIGVDVHGNILVQRHHTNGTGNWLNSFQIVKLTDATGSGNHQTVIADTADSGKSGMFDMPSTMGMGHGQVYAASYRNCDGEPDCTVGRMLFAFSTPGIGMDYPRGELWESDLITDAVPFAAFGDSYISGEGDNQEGFVLERQACHVSYSAWPMRVNGDTRLNLSLSLFPACSGATTSDTVYGDPNRGQPAQLMSYSTPVKAVAISAGGNDIGFEDLIVTCILSDCQNLEQQTLNKINQLESSWNPWDESTLTGLYTYTRFMVGPDADIYVMEYPYVLPNSSCATANLGVNSFLTALRNSDFSGGLSNWLTGMGISAAQVLADDDNGALTFSASEAAIARNITDQLNNKIESIVASRNDPKFHVVKANYAGGPFEGRTLCSSDPAFNGFFLDFQHPTALIGNVNMSFHPNHDGTAAYKKVFVDCRLDQTNCN